MDIKELKKANGDIFFEARRMPGNSFIQVNWIGIQSLETMIMGGNHLLAMLRDKSCLGLLNSNRELVGPWETAVTWWAFKWAPQAKLLGLRHFAHVWAHGIYGQKAFQQLQPNLEEHLEVATFPADGEAQAWLQEKYQQARIS